MDYYINDNFKNTERVSSEEGRYQYRRFDMNENPVGLPKEFVESVKKEITPEFLAIYPEPGKFISKYAKYEHISENNILTANGSDMAMRYIFETFSKPNSDVVVVSPTFAMYRINCLLSGSNYTPVNLNERFDISINSIIDKITDNTSLVIVVNPNNPTGNVYKNEDLDQIAVSAKNHGAILVIDEAYYHFYGTSYIRKAVEQDNVIVLRTFSKALSIASCRIGVIIGNNKIIHYLFNGRLSYDVNSIALLFAERLLDNPSVIESLIIQEKKGRMYMENMLEKNGYEIVKCQANFILIRPKSSPGVLYERLKEKGVLVHLFSSGTLDKYIRVTTGDKDSMSYLFSKLIECDY